MFTTTKAREIRNALADHHGHLPKMKENTGVVEEFMGNKG
jgi:hypothetical protein